MKIFGCAFCAALAVAAVMGGDDSVRGAEEYYEKGHDYFRKMDMEKAFKSYRRAAALGNAKALVEIGLFYENGWQIDKDPELAKKYFTDAEPGLLKLAEKDDAEAQLDLSVYYWCYASSPEKYEYWSERAVENFRRAAARGDAHAQFRLEALYKHGGHVKRNLSEALKWCRKAAEQGHPEATFTVGIYYAKGLGVKPDQTEAMKWFHLASERGYSMADVVIAEHYEYDKKDMGEALKWYRRAAAHGNKLAEFLLRQRNEPLEEPQKPKPTTSIDRR